jgi:GldM C-terminal domain
MRYLFLLTCALFLSFISYGQSDFSAGISLDRMNVVYTTLPNPISVYTSVPFSDIECSINRNGQIQQNAYGRYEITVKQEGYYEFKITQKSSGLSVTHTIRAKKLPIPVAILDNTIGDTISIAKLAEVTKLSLRYVPSVDWNIVAQVDSFTLLKIVKEGDRMLVNNNGATFSNKTLELIRSCKRGDILIFKNIKGLGVDPGELKIRDIIVYVE